MKEPQRFQPDREDVRTERHSHRLAYIIRELPARLEALTRGLTYPADGRVLDYGCADVPYRHFFPGSVEYLAADIAGNPDANVLIGAEGTVPVPDRSVDLVLSTQVLEHVTDPAVYLAECHRVLRPGGQLLLSTHGFMVYHPDPVDLWRWTGAGLREAVERTGLRVIRFEGIMGLTATGLQFFQDGLYFRLSPRIRPAFAYVMQKAVAIADRHESAASRNANALVFALVAQKPHAPSTDRALSA